MLAWILLGLSVIVVGALLIVWWRKRPCRASGQKMSPKKLPNGNVIINGREYLSPEASRALDEAGNEMDPRFIGSKTWN